MKSSAPAISYKRSTKNTYLRASKDQIRSLTTYDMQILYLIHLAVSFAKNDVGLTGFIRLAFTNNLFEKKTNNFIDTEAIISDKNVNA